MGKGAFPINLFPTQGLVGLCCAAEGGGLGGVGRLGKAGTDPEPAFAGELLQYM